VAGKYKQNNLRTIGLICTVRSRESNFDPFLLSSDLTVHNRSIVGDTFIKKLTPRIPLIVFLRHNNELEFDIEV
jgi:hypothetical protein